MVSDIELASLCPSNMCGHAHQACIESAGLWEYRVLRASVPYSHDLRARIGEENYRHVREIYDEKTMVDAYAPALRQCKVKIGTENDDGLGIRLGLAAGGEAISPVVSSWTAFARWGGGIA